VRPCGTARAMNSVKGMQADDGPDSWQLEWHQDGVKTKSDDYCVNCGLNSGVRSGPSCLEPQNQLLAS
jgi:hypothetical protein